MCTYERGNINRFSIYRSGVSLYFIMQWWTYGQQVPTRQCVGGPEPDACQQSYKFSAAETEPGNHLAIVLHM